MRSITWKYWCAIALLVPLYSWLICVLPPVGAIEFALHMAEKGEHCSSFCEHRTAFEANSVQWHGDVEVCGVPCPLVAPVRAVPCVPLTNFRPPPLTYLIAGALRAPPPFPHS